VGTVGWLLIVWINTMYNWMCLEIFRL